MGESGEKGSKLGVRGEGKVKRKKKLRQVEED